MSVDMVDATAAHIFRYYNPYRLIRMVFVGKLHTSVVYIYSGMCTNHKPNAAGWCLNSTVDFWQEEE